MQRQTVINHAQSPAGEGTAGSAFALAQPDFRRPVMDGSSPWNLAVPLTSSPLPSSCPAQPSIGPSPHTPLAPPLPRGPPFARRAPPAAGPRRRAAAAASWSAAPPRVPPARHECMLESLTLGCAGGVSLRQAQPSCLPPLDTTRARGEAWRGQERRLSKDAPRVRAAPSPCAAPRGGPACGSPRAPPPPVAKVYRAHASELESRGAVD